MAMKKNRPSFSTGAVLFVFGVAVSMTGVSGLVIGIPAIVVGCLIMAGV